MAVQTNPGGASFLPLHTSTQNPPQQENRGGANPSTALVAKPWLLKHKRPFNSVTQAESIGSSGDAAGPSAFSTVFVFLSFISKKRRAESLTTVLVVLEDFGDVAGIDEAKELLERRQWARGAQREVWAPSAEKRPKNVKTRAVDTHSQQDLQRRAQHLDVLVVQETPRHGDDVVVVGGHVGVQHRRHQAAGAVLHPPGAVKGGVERHQEVPVLNIRTERGKKRACKRVSLRPRPSLTHWTADWTGKWDATGSN